MRSFAALYTNHVIVIGSLLSGEGVKVSKIRLLDERDVRHLRNTRITLERFPLVPSCGQDDTCIHPLYAEVYSFCQWYYNASKLVCTHKHTHTHTHTHTHSLSLSHSLYLSPVCAYKRYVFRHKQKHHDLRLMQKPYYQQTHAIAPSINVPKLSL